MLILAADGDNLYTYTEVWITLTDINDNAPFLRMVRIRTEITLALNCVRDLIIVFWSYRTTL